MLTHLPMRVFLTKFYFENVTVPKSTVVNHSKHLSQYCKANNLEIKKSANPDKHMNLYPVEAYSGYYGITKEQIEQLITVKNRNEQSKH